MEKYLQLADQFMKMRRSFPYIKFDKEVTECSKHEMHILNYLALHGGVAHPKELSSEFIVSSARMSVLLNQLEEKEYICRISDSEDNRQTIVKLEPKGKEFFEKVNDKALKVVAHFFNELGDNDATEFVRLFTKLMNFVS